MALTNSATFESRSISPVPEAVAPFPVSVPIFSAHPTQSVLVPPPIGLTSSMISLSQVSATSSIVMEDAKVLCQSNGMIDDRSVDAQLFSPAIDKVGLAAHFLLPSCEMRSHTI
jgi:hypothetical protein